ncbi:regulatory protein spx [Carnobacterium iners]|uniref:Regulatory protein spx n=1 Tax=Carnobacterium iners TaxID=1073423 RepID=A0A1X7N6X7_9LACT|nr:transcriptional regulator SpxA [Carnobacterium iners]SEK59965.1 regulatory protein spx [Carnobacterium iners]SMH32368.1 regulatory protein spx [Carnobacterium iners]
MIILYTTPSCASCRKARTWLKENNIEYLEKNIFKDQLTEYDLKVILSLTENGTEEIISFRSQIFHDLNIDMEDISLKELIHVILENPSLIRRPILIDDKRLQIGFNEEDIRRFLPRDIRKLELKKLQEKILMNY